MDNYLNYKSLCFQYVPNLCDWSIISYKLEPFSIYSKMLNNVEHKIKKKIKIIDIYSYLENK